MMTRSRFATIQFVSRVHQSSPTAPSKTLQKCSPKHLHTTSGTASENTGPCEPFHGMTSHWLGTVCPAGGLARYVTRTIRFGANGKAPRRQGQLEGAFPSWVVLRLSPLAKRLLGSSSLNTFPSSHTLRTIPSSQIVLTSSWMLRC